MFDDDIGFETKYFRGCPKCGGKGFSQKDKDTAEPCDCWRLDTLRSRLRKANIPEDYLEVSLEQLEKNVSGYMIEYNDNAKNKEDRILQHTIDIHRFFNDFVLSLHNIKRSGKSLLLLGGNGVGKTMLACIILKNALWYSVISKKLYSDYSGYFITFGKYIDSFFKASKDEESSEFLDFIRKVDFLVLDEVGAEPVKKDGPTDFYRSVLDDLLRYRSNNKLVTLITSNMSEKEFKTHYKQSEYQDFNRIWSIIEGKYIIISLKRLGGDFRKKKRKETIKKVVDKYKK